MEKKSVKHRFAISLLANGLGGLLTGVTSLILARSLGPSNYGIFVFLTGSFIAIRAVADLGSGVAFYTFISQKTRGIKFLRAYFRWQGIQLLIPVLVVGVLLPESWVDNIWLNQDRGVILLAFLAVFMRFNAWQTLVYLGESQRLTARVQKWTVTLTAVHLLIVVLLWWASLISLNLILLVISIEYVVALSLAVCKFDIHLSQKCSLDGSKLWQKYRNYCTPLIGLSFCVFGSEFADRWLLQRYGGPVEQAYYGIGKQLAVVGLLMTTSLVNIFWKEISEAHSLGNHPLVKQLYDKSTKFLFFIAACFSGYLIPWSSEIISLLFGSVYSEGSLVLAIMLLYPIHRSFYQLTVSYLLGVGNTKIHLKISAIFWGLSIPITYLIQADENAFVPGLGMGAVGIALKIIILQILETNIMHWWISKNNNWKVDWVSQWLCVGATLGAGFISYKIVMAINFAFMQFLAFKFVLCFLIFTLLVGCVIWLMPSLTGTSRSELVSYAAIIGRFISRERS